MQRLHGRAWPWLPLAIIASVGIPMRLGTRPAEAAVWHVLLSCAAPRRSLYWSGCEAVFQIPYGAIGIGIAVILGIWAYHETYSTAGRIAIGVIILAIVLLPRLWHGQTGRIAQLLVGTVFGVACYIFIKLRGANIR